MHDKISERAVGRRTLTSKTNSHAPQSCSCSYEEESDQILSLEGRVDDKIRGHKLGKIMMMGLPL